MAEEGGEGEEGEERQLIDLQLALPQVKRIHLVAWPTLASV